MQPLLEAVNLLKKGGVIAYPTEAVYGLGCDPFNEHAVMRLLAIKQRAINKGLILIATEWSHVASLVKPLSDQVLQKIFTTWPGPITWVFPASSLAPAWICGSHTSIAIRLTAHPVARELCKLFNGPIVSTSANLEGKTPAKTADEVKNIFTDQIDYIIKEAVGNLSKPTEIRDALTGKTLRSA